MEYYITKHISFKTSSAYEKTGIKYPRCFLPNDWNLEPNTKLMYKVWDADKAEPKCSVTLTVARPHGRGVFIRLKGDMEFDPDRLYTIKVKI